MRSSGPEAAHGAAPDVLAPPPRHPRFPHSDGVRGLAAIAVVVVHSWLFAGGGGLDGSLGDHAVVRLDSMVAIFFLLSAFLLYRPMIAHRAGGPTAPRVRDFARRRFLRIYPAYWVALTVLAIVPGLVGVFSGKWWVFYSLGEYLHPLTHTSACDGGPGYNCGLLQSWTLTVEVTFYLVLPLYAALTATLARRLDVRGWMRAELSLIAILALTSMVLAGPLSLRDESWFNYSFAAHLDWLGLGLAMAVLSVVYGRREEALPPWLRFLASRPGLCWAGAFSIYAVTVVAFPPIPFTVAPFTTPQFLGIHLAQCGVAALLLIPVAFGDPNFGLPRRILANPLLLWLGLVSYGFYLWQVTIGIKLGFGGAEAGFLTILIGTSAVALPLAAASYYLIERPLMSLKYRTNQK
ncbi:MAG: acyltransferase [Geodermatophilaceae bacterium]|nr:acyltransferase [Geodermatophilaceae bacterium]